MILVIYGIFRFVIFIINCKDYISPDSLIGGWNKEKVSNRSSRYISMSVGFLKFISLLIILSVYMVVASLLNTVWVI